MEDNYKGAEHTYIVETIQPIKTIDEIFMLDPDFCKTLLLMPNPFGNDALRESVFLNNYSRTTTIDVNYVRTSESTPFILPNGEAPITRKQCKPRKESYADVVIRVIEGLFSHYIYHLKKNYLGGDRKKIMLLAEKMALSMMKFEWTPPGRGYFTMGTNYCYKNGNAALNNCYATTTKDNFVEAMSWSMSNLMCGGGVGTDTDGKFDVIKPDKDDSFVFQIPDSRQGWVAALELILRAYIPIDGKITNKFPIFDYSLIRPYGAPIKGFGGTASGPEPLEKLLKFVEACLDSFIKWKETFEWCKCLEKRTFNRGNLAQVGFYLEHFDRLKEIGIYTKDDMVDEIPELIRTTCMKYYQPYNHTHLIMDIFNMIGWCVHAGNVRRSAQIVLGDGDDPNFINIKDWMRYAYRRPYMSNSNNSVRLYTSDDFKQYLPMIVSLIKINGEPGIVNMINISKYGRYTDLTYGPDNGTLLNPCGETILKDKEPCCLAIVNPMNCRSGAIIDRETLRNACKYATFYATVVNTIPHEWACTNKVKAINMRIGISFGGIADVYDTYGNVELVDVMREMYREIRTYNKNLSSKLGIAPSIRTTVVKPDGTISFIANTSKGVHHNIIAQGIRRIAYANNSPIVKVLKDAGYKYEESEKGNTTYILFPFKTNSRSANTVPAWEKMALIEEAQRHFADNSVSATLDFDTVTEGPYIESLITINIAKLKSISAFPQFDTTNCQFKHLPYQPLNDVEFAKLKEGIKPIDWFPVYHPAGEVEDADAESVLGCTGGICEIKKMKAEFE